MRIHTIWRPALLGALLFVVAVFPFGQPQGKKVEARETIPEEL